MDHRLGGRIAIVTSGSSGVAFAEANVTAALDVSGGRSNNV